MFYNIIHKTNRYNIGVLNDRNTYKLYYKYQSKLIKNLKKWIDMSTYKKFGLLILLSFLTLGVFAQELVRVSNNINEVRVIEEDNNGLLLNVEVGSYVKNDVSINGKTYYSITNDEGNLIYEKGYPD